MDTVVRINGGDQGWLPHGSGKKRFRGWEAAQ